MCSLSRTLWYNIRRNTSNTMHSIDGHRAHHGLDRPATRPAIEIRWDPNPIRAMTSRGSLTPAINKTRYPAPHIVSGGSAVIYELARLLANRNCARSLLLIETKPSCSIKRRNYYIRAGTSSMASIRTRCGTIFPRNRSRTIARSKQNAHGIALSYRSNYREYNAPSWLATARIDARNWCCIISG